MSQNMSSHEETDFFGYLQLLEIKFTHNNHRSFYPSEINYYELFHVFKIFDPRYFISFIQNKEIKKSFYRLFLFLIKNILCKEEKLVLLSNFIKILQEIQNIGLNDLKIFYENKIKNNFLKNYEAQFDVSDSISLSNLSLSKNKISLAFTKNESYFRIKIYKFCLRLVFLIFISNNKHSEKFMDSQSIDYFFFNFFNESMKISDEYRVPFYEEIFVLFSYRKEYSYLNDENLNYFIFQIFFGNDSQEFIFIKQFLLYMPKFESKKLEKMMQFFSNFMSYLQFKNDYFSDNLKILYTIDKEQVKTKPKEEYEKIIAEKDFFSNLKIDQTSFFEKIDELLFLNIISNSNNFHYFNWKHIGNLIIFNNISLLNVNRFLSCIFFKVYDFMKNIDGNSGSFFEKNYLKKISNFYDEYLEVMESYGKNEKIFYNMLFYKNYSIATGINNPTYEVFGNFAFLNNYLILYKEGNLYPNFPDTDLPLIFSLLYYAVKNENLSPAIFVLVTKFLTMAQKFKPDQIELETLNMQFMNGFSSFIPYFNFVASIVIDNFEYQKQDPIKNFINFISNKILKKILKNIPDHSYTLENHKFLINILHLSMRFCESLVSKVSLKLINYYCYNKSCMKKLKFSRVFFHCENVYTCNFCGSINYCLVINNSVSSNINLFREEILNFYKVMENYIELFTKLKLPGKVEAQEGYFKILKLITGYLFKMISMVDYDGSLYDDSNNDAYVRKFAENLSLIEMNLISLISGQKSVNRKLMKALEHIKKLINFLDSYTTENEMDDISSLSSLSILISSEGRKEMEILDSLLNN